MLLLGSDSLNDDGHSTVVVQEVVSRLSVVEAADLEKGNG